MSRAQSYSHLVGLAVFFVIYVIVLFMQNDVQAHYAIQASYKDSILAGLPEGGLLSSANDLFDWLQEEIAERAWTEPVCGDGTCEWSPEEYPGFGRFGCIADCNRYLYTTQITVDLLPLYNASQRMLGWDLTKVNHRGREPQFKWNIWSDTMGAYLLEHDALASDGARVLEVPDGKFELRLYQTRSMADLLDISAITANRPLGPPISDTSVPRRSDSIPAFKYGDQREALASQSEMAAQVFDYCFGAIDPQNFDWQCMYPPTDQFLKIFGGYGVNGTIKMGNGSRSTANLVEVPFCGVVSDGIQGLSNHSKGEIHHESGVYARTRTRMRTNRHMHAYSQDNAHQGRNNVPHKPAQWRRPWWGPQRSSRRRIRTRVCPTLSIYDETTGCAAGDRCQRPCAAGSGVHPAARGRVCSGAGNG